MTGRKLAFLFMQPSGKVAFGRIKIPTLFALFLSFVDVAMWTRAEHLKDTRSRSCPYAEDMKERKNSH